MKENVSFHIPIALQKGTNLPKNVKEVPQGLDCNCYCPVCNEDLIAAKGEKNQHHFKHQSNSNCTINGETYIHWLSKIVFEREKQIVLPAIYSEDLELDNKNMLTDLVNSTVHNYEKKHGVSISSYFKTKFSNKNNYNPFNKILVKDSELITFDEVNSEEVKTSIFGKVRADIIGHNSNQMILIEPYVTNQINDNKLKKLIDLNFTTISINLIDFYIKNNWYFEYNQFKDFLINHIPSKKWVTMSTEFKSNNHGYLTKMIESNLNSFLDENIELLLDFSREIETHESLLKRRMEIDKSINRSAGKIKEHQSFLFQRSGSISKILDLKTDSFFDYNLE